MEDFKNQTFQLFVTVFQTEKAEATKVTPQETSTRKITAKWCKIKDDPFIG